ISLMTAEKTPSEDSIGTTNSRGAVMVTAMVFVKGDHTLNCTPPDANGRAPNSRRQGFAICLDSDTSFDASGKHFHGFVGTSSSRFSRVSRRASSPAFVRMLHQLEAARRRSKWSCR